ncbi:hypothetical protein [Luteibacter sp. 3190]|uniref:hypothetical protein n=1 Tax=Luteibacter sp. 3190 TaxID=2817736 RepID=UPI0028585809|nr:hypothetical protein [Luteibacter sp. 3190]MDR6937710.1 hypothetical protein [Luteibacter sp. 3190]
MKLPDVITSSDEYATLDVSARASLVRRIEEAVDLGAELASGSRSSSYPDFFQFADDLELDLSHLQEFSPAGRLDLTRWAVHYSWVFHTSPLEMRNQLDERLLRLIDVPEPSSDAPIATFDRWIADLGSGLVSTVQGVEAATQYSAALAHLICLDILLARLLMACFRLRLNPSTPR